MVYFKMRQKLLHRMKGMCGATSRMMKDERRTDSGKTSSGQNPAFNLYLYIFIHRCIIFLP